MPSIFVSSHPISNIQILNKKKKDKTKFVLDISKIVLDIVHVVTMIIYGFFPSKHFNFTNEKLNFKNNFEKTVLFCSWVLIQIIVQAIGGGRSKVWTIK